MHMAKTDLQDHLKRSIMSIVDVKTCMHNVLCGIARMHADGIVHRDVKPANILLDNHKAPQLCDFGISARSEDISGYAGTRRFVAPEVLELRLSHTDSQTTCAADLFSAGVTMFYILFRMFPWSTSEIENLVRTMRHDDFASFRVSVKTHVDRGFRRLNLHGHASMRDLLIRLLEPNPTLRVTAEQATHHAWFNPIVGNKKRKLKDGVSIRAAKRQHSHEKVPTG